VELSNELKITFISCGFDHVILITVNGRVFGYGSDFFGQIGGGKRERNGMLTLSREFFNG
jgi:alpha-tubulin suppressor-like RCC1 family protein